MKIVTIILQKAMYEKTFNPLLRMKFLSLLYEYTEHSQLVATYTTCPKHVSYVLN